MKHKRILCFSEAVTLAHVARPIVLARSWQRFGFESVFACDVRYNYFMKGETWQSFPLNSVSSQKFMRNLALGKPVYDVTTLRSYVAEDIKLIEYVKPDLIVGDFRLSLSVSARLVGIPYAAITNAYWSPFCLDKTFPLPVLPLSRYLPLPIAQPIFDIFKHIAFSWHCHPLNQLKNEHGLAPFGSDLRSAYTDADYILYADAPDMFPVTELPQQHRFLGPVLWSPPVEKPSWWNDLPVDKPIVYLTLGSSGSPRVLEMILKVLANQPVTVIASTAGAIASVTPAANIYVTDYLSGDDAAARSSLVICNGGSPTSQQALACGVPVLGIASNMDQFMNMAAIERSRAGVLLRADRVNEKAVHEALMRLIHDPSYRHHALELADAFSRLNSGQAFCNFVSEVFHD